MKHLKKNRLRWYMLVWNPSRIYIYIYMHEYAYMLYWSSNFLIYLYKWSELSSSKIHSKNHLLFHFRLGAPTARQLILHLHRQQLVCQARVDHTLSLPENSVLFSYIEQFCPLKEHVYMYVLKQIVSDKRESWCRYVHIPSYLGFSSATSIYETVRF